MRRAVWIVAWILVALWSLFAWGAYGLLGVFGNLAAGNADIVASDPQIVESISSVFVWLRSLGHVAIVLVWAVVSAAILAVAWVLSRLAPGDRRDGTALYPPSRPNPTIQPPPVNPRDPAAQARDAVERFRPRR